MPETQEYPYAVANYVDEFVRSRDVGSVITLEQIRNAIPASAAAGRSRDALDRTILIRVWNLRNKGYLASRDSDGDDRSRVYPVVEQPPAPKWRRARKDSAAGRSRRTLSLKTTARQQSTTPSAPKPPRVPANGAGGDLSTLAETALSLASALEKLNVADLISDEKLVPTSALLAEIGRRAG